MSLPGTPLGLIGNATWVNGIGYWASVTGRYTLAASPDSSFGLLLGLNQSWAYPTQTPSMVFQDIGHGALGSILGAQPLKMFGGVYYEHTWDRVRLRLSPVLSHYAPFTGSYRTPFFNLVEAGLVGTAWVEVGYKVSPNFELSLKSNVHTPLSMSMTF